MSELHYIVRDLQRRVANMIRRGRVHSVDFELVPPRVRVEYEKGVVTGWLPWISGRESSQHRTDWEPLAIGEQVLILSESGELAAGVVIPSLPDATSPVPSTSPDEHVSRYEDGTSFTYNRVTHTLTLDVQGDVVLHTTGKFTGTIDGDVELHTKSNVTGHIEGNVTAQIDGSATLTVKQDTTVKSEATLNVTAADNLTLKSAANLVLDASGNVDIQAGGNVKVTGTRIDWN